MAIGWFLLTSLVLLHSFELQSLPDRKTDGNCLPEGSSCGYASFDFVGENILRINQFMTQEVRQKTVKEMESLYNSEMTLEVQAHGLIVSSAAVLRDVMQCSPERNGCSHSNHIPFPFCFKQPIKSVNFR